MVGNSTSFINGYCRREECQLGNLFTDAMLDFYNRKFPGDPAMISLANAGVFRDSIRNGSITREHLLNVFPYANHICVTKITGQELLDILEFSVRR